MWSSLLEARHTCHAFHAAYVVSTSRGQTGPSAHPRKRLDASPDLTPVPAWIAGAAVGKAPRRKRRRTLPSAPKTRLRKRTRRAVPITDSDARGESSGDGDRAQDAGPGVTDRGKAFDSDSESGASADEPMVGAGAVGDEYDDYGAWTFWTTCMGLYVCMSNFTNWPCSSGH
jgi:hypothetical protein